VQAERHWQCGQDSIAPAAKPGGPCGALCGSDRLQPFVAKVNAESNNSEPAGRRPYPAANFVARLPMCLIVRGTNYSMES
jgi:hypothetical protein